MRKIRKRKTLNKLLLLKVAGKLRRMRHEKHYSQETWCEVGSCGTAACIAGHVLLESGFKVKEIEKLEDKSAVPGAAAKLLGVQTRHMPQLFSAYPDEDWPEVYARRWKARASLVEGGERPSRIAADLLEAIVNGEVKINTIGGWVR